MEAQSSSLKIEELVEILSGAHQKGSEETATFVDMMEWLTNQLQTGR